MEGRERERRGKLGIPSVPYLPSVLDFFQCLQQVFALRNSARGIDMRELNHAFSIDDERRTEAEPLFFVEDTVGLGDRAVGPVVGEERERNPAEAL